MSKPYACPIDVTDEEWVLVRPYLLVSREDSGSRTHSPRAVFDAYRYLLRAGCGWRMLPGDLPPCKAVYDRVMRWHAAGVFEAIIVDVRGLIRVGEGGVGAPRPRCSTAAPSRAPPRARGRPATVPSA